MPVKLHGAQSELHDALLVVDYDNPPEPSIDPAFITESK